MMTGGRQVRALGSNACDHCEDGPLNQGTSWRTIEARVYETSAYQVRIGF